MSVETYPVVRGGILCPLLLGRSVGFMEWSFRSAEELAAALRVGEVTSVELIDEAIARIKRHDKAINALC
jgi:amidase